MCSTPWGSNANPCGRPKGMFNTSTRPSGSMRRTESVRGERWRGHKQVAVRRHREMERGDARRNAREGLGTALRIDLEDGAAAIADIQRAVGAKRQPARHTEIRRHDLIVPIVEHPVDAAFEAARHIQMSVRPHRHRGGVHECMHERLACAVAANSEDRNGRLLAAGSAIGDVEVAVGAEDRVVDLVQAGRHQDADARVECRARNPRHLDGRLATLEARRDHDGQTIGCGKGHPCRHAADRHKVRRGIRFREAVAAHPQPSAFHNANRL